MSDDTTTQPPKGKSTSQHQCSQGSGHRCVNLHLVFWLMLMTPSMVSFLAIWHWQICRTEERIGINAGRIRAINSKIRGGEVQHTGVIPFLKKFEATVRCCTQNGIRGGSATVHFPIWHREIEDIIVLKNNKGTEDNR
ncbi:MAG: hypothetical protein CM15mV13_1600 [uncultured marine virus]|nr:MAG: hypothetical protein CM15mV13_1600 [uncultured marine virus]